MYDSQKIRNIAIIAHVDHGKTTLVDQLLKKSETLASRENIEERAMDSNDIKLIFLIHLVMLISLVKLKEL